MAMILPERTVDAWTAAYITGRRWRARLWAPTERKPSEKYDLGVGLGKIGGGPGLPVPDPWPDKVFVLEHKGVDERGGDAIVWIRIRQLREHFDADRARGGRLVYYLLPDPEWRGRPPAPYGRIPDASVRRTRGPKLPSSNRSAWDGFQLWARVIHVSDMLALMRAHCLKAPSRFQYGPARGSRADDWAFPLPTSQLAGIPNSLTLRDFVTAVRDCTEGRLATDAYLSGARPAPSVGPLGPSPDLLGDALSVAPAADREDGPPGPAGDDREPSEDDGAPDVFARPQFLTFYGVGDAKLDPT